jgi:putative DNA primase/helicase
MTPPQLHTIAESEQPSWMDECIWETTKHGGTRLAKCTNNAIAILGQAPEWKNKIKLDTFSGRVSITDPPWPKAYHISDAHPRRKPRRISDLDVERARAWLRLKYDLQLSTADVRSSIGIVAENNAESSAAKYMDAIKWDGTPRIDTWMTDYMGAEDTEFARTVGKWWLKGAVARVYIPGVKFDNVLVFEGDQRIGKSTALKALASPEWFSDTPIEVGNKDAYSRLPGRLIVELAEIDSITKKADVAAVKAFFSSATDTYRPAYGRFDIESNRQSVFAATVNPTNAYLFDESGNTRFWPVECGVVGPIQYRSVEKDRDQIWAEAVASYRSDPKFWPETQAEHDLCEEQQSKRAPERDSWCQIIETWIAGIQYESESEQELPLTVPRVIEGALKIQDRSKWGQREERRVSACLRLLGYHRHRTGPRTARSYTWHLPPHPEPGSTG